MPRRPPLSSALPFAATLWLTVVVPASAQTPGSPGNGQVGTGAASLPTLAISSSATTTSTTTTVTMGVDG